MFEIFECKCLQKKRIEIIDIVVTLKEGLSCGSSFQHSFINSIIEEGEKSSGKGILSFFLNRWITWSFVFPGQGFSPFEKISNKTTPKEKTSLLVEILSLKMTSGALH